MDLIKKNRLLSRVSKKTFLNNLRITDPNKELNRYLDIRRSAIFIELEQQYEVIFPDTSINKWPNKKILLDPGHLGDGFARLEKRDFFGIKEGDLNYKISSKIYSWLKNKKVPAYLTRKKGDLINIAAKTLEKSELEVLKGNPDENFLLNKIIKTDLSNRIKKINRIKPYILLSIHNNANSSEFLTDYNGIMIFIPGFFLKKELEQLEQRRSFMEILVNSDFEYILKLARIFLKYLKMQLKLESALPEMFNKEISNNFCKVEEGIYVRNLAIFRSKAFCPILLEGPFLNNRQIQTLFLSKGKDVVVIPYSTAITQAFSDIFRCHFSDQFI